MPSAERNKPKSISVFFKCFVEYRWWPSYHAIEDKPGIVLAPPWWAQPLRGWVWPLQKHRAHPIKYVCTQNNCRAFCRSAILSLRKHISSVATRRDVVGQSTKKGCSFLSWSDVNAFWLRAELPSNLSILPAIITSPPASTGRRALRPLEDYAIKLFRRMASILTMQIGSQTNGTYGNYIISKQLHRNIWRAIYLDTHLLHYLVRFS